MASFVCAQKYVAFKSYSLLVDSQYDNTVQPTAGTTPTQRPVFQNMKRFQVKSLYLEPLVGDHLSSATATTLRANVWYFFVFLF